MPKEKLCGANIAFCSHARNEWWVEMERNWKRFDLPLVNVNNFPLVILFVGGCIAGEKNVIISSSCWIPLYYIIFSFCIFFSTECCAICYSILHPIFISYKWISFFAKAKLVVLQLYFRSWLNGYRSWGLLFRFSFSLLCHGVAYCFQTLERQRVIYDFGKEALL